MIKGVLIDLGNTIIEQKVDNVQPLSSMELIAFPDSQPTLAELKSLGFYLAIVTNTTQSNSIDVAKALEKLDLLRYIDTIVTSVDLGVEKPDPIIFRTAIQNLNLSPKEVIMVGDNIDQDIAGAIELGIKTIFLKRGTTNISTDLNPTFIVTSLQEIIPLLKSYTGNESSLGESLSARVATTSISSKEEAARDAQNMMMWNDAARYYTECAEQSLQEGEYEKSASHYMRAARCREQNEEWRETGNLWVSAARALERMSQRDSAKSYYEDYDASKHFFMGIDPKHWDRLPLHERIGRAYRYAGYHLEQGGSNQSAYNQYHAAGMAFEEAKEWDQASRAYYLALISFIHQFGELNQEYLQRLENSIKKCFELQEMIYLQRSHIYFRRIAFELQSQGNDEDRKIISQKYHETSRKIALENKNFQKWFLYSLWKGTSGYGTNFNLWLTWAMVIAVLIFPALYSGFNLLSPQPKSWLDSVYFSVTTFITLNYIDFLPIGWGRIIALLETIVGLFMLGSLVSIIINKISR